MNTVDYTAKWKSENNNQIVIDIETMPNPDVIHLLPEPTIDARLKDPVKVAEAKTEAKEKQLDRMALSPLTGKIAAIGFHGLLGGEVIIDDEKVMLDMAFQIITNSQIITYNGKAFDIPFIFKRGIILGCQWATIPEMKLYTDRYKSEAKHIDLMVEFCNYGENEKLDNLAKFILGSGKIEFDFKQIPELLKTEEGEQKIKDYCLKDCKLTLDLAKRMGF